MTRNRSVILAVVLTLGGSVAFAEDLRNAQSQSVPAQSQAQGQHQPEPLELLDSSAIARMKITDKHGKKIGKLERLLIDGKSGRVRFAVVQVDKEWNLNDPEVMLPFGVLEISRQGVSDYRVMVDATRERLLNAPRFGRKLIEQITTREAAQPVYAYWGIRWDEEDLAVKARTEGAGADRGSAVSSTGAADDRAKSAAQSTNTSGTSRPKVDGPARTSTEPKETTREELKPKEESSDAKRDPGETD